MEEVAGFFRATHNPRTTLLNAMRHLATSADLGPIDLCASSIYTLTDALVEVISDERQRRRSPRFRTQVPLLLIWNANEQELRESTSTVTISRFGCALHSQGFIQPGTSVRLEHKGNVIEGAVVYSLKDHTRRLVEVGVAFDGDGWDFWS
jgi:translation initiation factor IF-2